MGDGDDEKASSSTGAYRTGEAKVAEAEVPRSSRLLKALAQWREIRGDAEESSFLAERALRAQRPKRQRQLGRCIDGRDALANGKLALAQQTYGRWLDLAGAMPARDEDRIEALAAHAAISFVFGRPLAAENALRDAILAAKRLGQAVLADDAPPAAALCLAATWRRLSRVELAASVLSRVTAMSAPPLLAGAISHARAETALALGDIEAALFYANEATEIRAQVFGEQHLAHAASRALVGRVLHRVWRLNDAERALADSVGVMQQYKLRDAIVESETLAAIAELLWDQKRRPGYARTVRAARMIALAAVLTAGCGKPGDSWANKRFGEGGADRLRAEAASYVGLRENETSGVSSAGPNATTLPRPYVVFLQRGFTPKGDAILEFHPASAAYLGAEAPASEAGARALVIISEENRCEGRVTNKGCKGKSVGYALTTIIDRQRKSTRTFEIIGLDSANVFGSLRGLPGEPLP